MASTNLIRCYSCGGIATDDTPVEPQKGFIIDGVFQPDTNGDFINAYLHTNPLACRDAHYLSYLAYCADPENDDP